MKNLQEDIFLSKLTSMDLKLNSRETKQSSQGRLVHQVKLNEHTMYGIFQERGVFVIKEAPIVTGERLLNESFHQIEPKGEYVNRGKFTFKTQQAAMKHLQLIINEDVRYKMKFPAPAPVTAPVEDFPSDTPATDDDMPADDVSMDSGDGSMGSDGAEEGEGGDSSVKSIQKLTGKLTAELRDQIAAGETKFTVGALKSLLAVAADLPSNDQQEVLDKAESILNQDEKEADTDMVSTEDKPIEEDSRPARTVRVTGRIRFNDENTSLPSTIESGNLKISDLNISEDGNYTATFLCFDGDDYLAASSFQSILLQYDDKHDNVIAGITAKVIYDGDGLIKDELSYEGDEGSGEWIAKLNGVGLTVSSGYFDSNAYDETNNTYLWHIESPVPVLVTYKADSDSYEWEYFSMSKQDDVVLNLTPDEFKARVDKMVSQYGKNKPGAPEPASTIVDEADEVETGDDLPKYTADDESSPNANLQHEIFTSLAYNAPRQFNGKAPDGKMRVRISPVTNRNPGFAARFIPNNGYYECFVDYVEVDTAINDESGQRKTVGTYDMIVHKPGNWGKVADNRLTTKVVGAKKAGEDTLGAGVEGNEFAGGKGEYEYQDMSFEKLKKYLSVYFNDVEKYNKN